MMVMIAVKILLVDLVVVEVVVVMVEVVEVMIRMKLLIPLVQSCVNQGIGEGGRIVVS